MTLSATNNSQFPAASGPCIRESGLGCAVIQAVKQSNALKFHIGYTGIFISGQPLVSSLSYYGLRGKSIYGGSRTAETKPYCSRYETQVEVDYRTILVQGQSKPKNQQKYRQR